MKKLATILFVLIFALAGHSQSQEFPQNNIGCNSTSFTIGSPYCQNPIIFEDYYYDGQDTNEIDGFDAVSILPGSHPISYYSEIKGIVTVFPSQLLIQVGELLLDLPPPSLSV